jgi:choline dehydrogenase-like flavoprotein
LPAIILPFALFRNFLILGACNTPQLLELSGIGNPAILKQFNIPTIVDLPGVGENFQDHLCLFNDFVASSGVFTFGEYENITWKEQIAS